MAIPVEHKTAARPSLLASSGWLQPLVLTGLMFLAFWPILSSIYQSWFYEYAYMEHGILVVPAALYMAWTLRDKLRVIPRQPSAWGILVMAWGALQALLGLAAHWVWFSRIAMLIALVGILAVSFGWRMVR